MRRQRGGQMVLFSEGNRGRVVGCSGHGPPQHERQLLRGAQAD